jgi:hypothetical protein
LFLPLGKGEIKKKKFFNSTRLLMGEGDKKIKNYQLTISNFYFPPFQKGELKGDF